MMDKVKRILGLASRKTGNKLVISGCGQGITYNVSADKSRVRIMRLVNGQWTEVNTVPDPNPTNPYVSTTSRDVGVFALVQR